MDRPIVFFKCQLKQTNLVLRSMSLVPVFKHEIIDAESNQTYYKRGFRLAFHIGAREDTTHELQDLKKSNGILASTMGSPNTILLSWSDLADLRYWMRFSVHHESLSPYQMHLETREIFDEVMDSIVFLNKGQTDPDMAQSFRLGYMLHAFLDFVGVTNVTSIAACDEDGYVLKNGRAELDLEDGWVDLKSIQPLHEETDDEDEKEDDDDESDKDKDKDGDTCMI